MLYEQRLTMSKIRNESIWKTILILVIVGLIKAHIHMMRLVMMLAVGLAGMYMLHVLAQDFNKIRKGWPFPQRPGRLLGLVKRSTEDVQLRTNVEIKGRWLTERINNETKQFPKVLKNDPIGCARKYVCHISGKNEGKLSEAAKNILMLLKAFKWLDTTGEWAKAEELGKSKAQEGACETNYSKCYYTAAQLEKFMNIL